MVKRSDTKHRMVAAAAPLLRERGYHATSLSDVPAEGNAPRGSTYLHFPGGKQELAANVVTMHATEPIHGISHAAATSRTPMELVATLLQWAIGESALPLAMHIVASIEGALGVGKALSAARAFDVVIAGLNAATASATHSAPRSTPLVESTWT